MSDGGVSHQPGLWGGKISSTQVKLNITQDMNGVKIACQGTNEALQRSINEAIELQVLCKYFIRIIMCLLWICELIMRNIHSFVHSFIVYFQTRKMWAFSWMLFNKHEKCSFFLNLACCCYYLISPNLTNISLFICYIKTKMYNENNKMRKQFHRNLLHHHHLRLLV